MSKIYIYLADETSILREGRYLPPSFTHIYYPENGKSARQIKDFVLSLPKNENDIAIVTDSLYFAREVYLNQIKVVWFNYNFEKGTVQDSECLNDLGGIAILDRELEQSERYMDFEIGVK
jgi:hypothetical protein